jgi:hypothetical protein
MLIEELMTAVTFYNGDRNGIHHLIGSETLAT